MARVFLSKEEAKTTWSHCIIAVIFIANHAIAIIVTIWDHLLVLVSSDDGSDVLKPTSGIYDV